MDAGARSGSGALPAQRDGVLEDDGLLDRRAVPLQVVRHRVAVRRARLVLDAGHLYDLLGRQLQQHLAARLDAAEDRLVLEAHQRLQPERQRLAQQLQVVLLVEHEPLLGPQHGHVLGGGQVHLHGRLRLALERVLEVRVGRRGTGTATSPP